MSIKKNNYVSNKNLYEKIKKIAKTKFKKWPSAYASSWLVKEYKRQGGKYTSKKTEKSGLSRWHSEEWIDVCKLPKIVPCGRENLKRTTWKKKYPYCRPKKRITSNLLKLIKTNNYLDIPLKADTIFISIYVHLNIRANLQKITTLHLVVKSQVA